MKEIKCVACGNLSKFVFLSHDLNHKLYDYYECQECKTIFCLDVPDENSSLGAWADERVVSNNERVDRVKQLVGGTATILDFGCGLGYLLSDLRKAGYDAEGYDKNHPDLNKFPCKEFDLIIMVEVIEHLAEPFTEIGMIANALKYGGYLIVESSFRWLDMPIAEIKYWHYIDPGGGHRSILSIEGLGLVCNRYGLMLCHSFNKNVWVFRKVKK